MDIVLLGSGHVATHLGRALHKIGYHIVQVWSRTGGNAKVLASEFGAQGVSSLSLINPSAALYILAVRDDAIVEVAAALPLAHHPILVHTSGSRPLQVLERFSSHVGVFYPIQTFSKTRKIDFKQVPIAIEGNSAELVRRLQGIAKKISDQVIEISTAQRATLHMAAVFACNFTNHLYHLADRILQEQNLSFNLLQSLIAETAAKVQEKSPLEMQTGPAVRRDTQTMYTHLSLLKNNPLLATLYEKLSQSIMEQTTFETG